MNGSVMTELPADVRSLFTGANYDSLATVLPDGSPHTLPQLVGVERERLAVMLIASRALLGVGGAAVTPSVLALVTGRNPRGGVGSGQRCSWQG